MSTALYKLKRDYGEGIDVYRSLGETVDLATGKKVSIKTKQHVRRAILLPSRVARDFVKQAGYAGNITNAKYQGLFDSSQRQIVIDKTDLHDQFKTLTTADWIIFNHIRWEISEIDEFEQNIAYWLLVKQVKGAPKYEIHTLHVKDQIKFTMEYIL